MTSPRSPVIGTAMPVSPSSSSSWVTAQPRSRMPTDSRRKSSGRVMVASVSASIGPSGQARAPQAKKTLPRAEQWAGTSISVQSRVPRR